VQRKDESYRINSKGVKPKTDTLDKYNFRYNELIGEYVLNIGGIINELFLSQDTVYTKKHNLI